MQTGGGIVKPYPACFYIKLDLFYNLFVRTTLRLVRKRIKYPGNKQTNLSKIVLLIYENDGLIFTWLP